MSNTQSSKLDQNINVTAQDTGEVKKENANTFEIFDRVKIINCGISHLEGRRGTVILVGQDNHYWVSISNIIYIFEQKNLEQWK